MKNKLQFLGLLSLALLTFSCSNDDYEIQDAKKNSDLKVILNDSLKKELNEIAPDLDKINAADGEPNNPKPPRR